MLLTFVSPPTQPTHPLHLLYFTSLSCRVYGIIIQSVWQSHWYVNYSETCNFILTPLHRCTAIPAFSNYPSSVDYCYFTIPTTMATFPNRSTRSKPTTIGRALTNFSHECHESDVGIQLTILEVTGVCSDDCANWSLLCWIKQFYTRNLNSVALPCVSL